MARSNSLTFTFRAITQGFVRDVKDAETATQGFDNSLKSVKTSSLDAREAAIKVEKAQQQLARAMKTSGEGSLRTADAQVKLERAQQKLASTTQETTKHQLKLSDGLKTVAKAAGAAALAYAGLDEAKKAIDTTEELTKGTIRLQRAFGLSAKEASAFVATAKTRGVDAKQLSQSFKTLASQLEGLSQGSKGAVKVFQDLGISATQVQGRPFADQLGAVSDALKNTAGSAKYAADASKLFGRGWQTVVPMLNKGQQGIRDLIATADKYGVTLDGKTIKSARDLAQAQRESQLASMGLQLTLGRVLIPALTKVTTFANQVVLKFRQDWPGIKKSLTPVISGLSGVVDAISAVVKALASCKPLIGTIKSAFVGLGQAFAAFGKLLKDVVHGDIKDAFGDLADMGKGLLKIAFGWVPAFLHIGGQLGTALVKGIKAAVTGIGGALAHAAGDFGSAIKNWINAHTLFGDSINVGPLHLKIPALAHGGAVPGTGNRDSVPAMLMPGEHVLTKQEVQAMGGQRAVFAMRRALGGGGQSFGGGYAAGGVITRMQAVGDAISSRRLPYTYGGGHGSLGVGAPGFDCSGYVSAILGAGGFIRYPMAVREPLASNLSPANGPNDGEVVVGIRGTSGQNAHTMIRVGSKYYESGGGHGPSRVGGWDGSFQWFKPRGMGSTVATSAKKAAKAVELLVTKNRKSTSKMPTITTERQRKYPYANFFSKAWEKARTTASLTDDFKVAERAMNYWDSVAANTNPMAPDSAYVYNTRDAWRARYTDLFYGGNGTGDYTQEPLYQQIYGTGGPVSGAADTSGATTAASSDNSGVLADIASSLQEMNARAKATVGTVDGTLSAWVTQHVMGTAGGRVGLGNQLPSSPGVVARY